MSTASVIERYVAENKQGYVAYRSKNDELKPVYFFLPQGVEAAPHVAVWPQASKEWAQRWEPILLDAEQVGAKMDGEDILHSLAAGVVEGDGVHMFPYHFAAVPRVVGDETKYQVIWGRRNEDESSWHFWRLYSYVDDEAFSAYPMTRQDRQDRPPGWVAPIWMAAESTSSRGAPPPCNLNRINDLGTGFPGDSLTGGP